MVSWEVFEEIWCVSTRQEGDSEQSGRLGMLGLDSIRSTI
jgi:hypothetical protein